MIVNPITNRTVKKNGPTGKKIITCLESEDKITKKIILEELSSKKKLKPLPQKPVVKTSPVHIPSKPLDPLKSIVKAPIYTSSKPSAPLKSVAKTSPIYTSSKPSAPLKSMSKILSTRNNSFIVPNPKKINSGQPNYNRGPLTRVAYISFLSKKYPHLCSNLDIAKGLFDDFSINLFNLEDHIYLFYDILHIPEAVIYHVRKCIKEGKWLVALPVTIAFSNKKDLNPFPPNATSLHSNITIYYIVDGKI